MTPQPELYDSLDAHLDRNEQDELNTNGSRRPKHYRKCNADRRAQIITSMRMLRGESGRFPSGGECRRAKIADEQAVIKLFGSWEGAYAEAFPVDSSSERKVVIAGKLFLYDSKAPFEISGHSIRGALEYDVASERMKCHECGEFVHSLGNHIHRAHNTNAADYKLKNGLRASASLTTDPTRVAQSSAARKRIGMRGPEEAAQFMQRIRSIKPMKAARDRASKARVSGLSEKRNMAGRCRVQTLAKISRIAAVLGKTPSVTELEVNGVSFKDLVYHFGSASMACELAGLTPNPTGGPRKHGEDFLIRQLRVFFYNNGRIPRFMDFTRGFFTCSNSTYRYHFGSWRRAVEIAFSPREIAKDGFWARAVQCPQSHPPEAVGARA
jgi:hypothetical protein